MKTENKEITLQQKQQRQKLLVYPLIGTILILALYFIFAPEEGRNKVNEVNGYNIALPSPDDKILVGDKKAAYEAERQKMIQGERMRTLGDFAFTLGKDTITEKNKDLQVQESNIFPNTAGALKPHRQSSGEAYKTMTRELTKFYEPVVHDDEEKKKLQAEIELLKEKLEEVERDTQPDRELQLIEKSYQLASKYLTPSSKTGVNTLITHQAERNIKSTSRNKAIIQVSGTMDNVVSSLSQEIPDSLFLKKIAKPRNTKFLTAIEVTDKINRNTVRACVDQKQVLEFGGNEIPKIRLRLLEGIRAGAILIPRNTILTGDAKLQNGRLEVKITTLEYAGNILPVELEVYDLEGQKGINASGSEETDALKEAAGNMSNNLGTSITLTRNAGQQAATDIAKGVIQAGSQYLAKKIKTVKITLKPGHEVLILLPENN